MSKSAPLIKHNGVLMTVPRAIFTEMHGSPLDPSWHVKRHCDNQECIRPGHSRPEQKFNRFGRPVVLLPDRFRYDLPPPADDDFEDLVFMIADIGGQRESPEILSQKPGWHDYSVSQIASAQAAVLQRNL